MNWPNLNGPNRLLGMKVTLNPNLTKQGPAEQVRRTWKERLTTWPWRPWQPMKWVATTIPDPTVYRMGNTFVMHPATWDTLRAEIERDERTRRARV